jgi:hypothetical protein
MAGGQSRRVVIGSDDHPADGVILESAGTAGLEGSHYFDLLSQAWIE